MAAVLLDEQTCNGVCLNDRGTLLRRSTIHVTSATRTASNPNSVCQARSPGITARSLKSGLFHSMAIHVVDWLCSNSTVPMPERRRVGANRQCSRGRREATNFFSSSSSGNESMDPVDDLRDQQNELQTSGTLLGWPGGHPLFERFAVLQDGAQQACVARLQGLEDTRNRRKKPGVL